MKCNDTHRLIIQYLNGDLDRQSIVEIENHLRDCPECDGYVSFTRAAFAVVDSEKRVEPDSSFLDHVFDRLESPVTIRSYRNKMLSLAAAAAVIVFATFAGMSLARFSSSAYFTSVDTSIKSDILFANEMTIEPFENFFISGEAE